MTITRLLVANRGEIAIRIARAAAELGIEAVAVYSVDDVASLHVSKAHRAMALPGQGAAAYLDGEALLRAAREAGCDAVHPGYGFLSENAGFAAACRKAGLVFVGPAPRTLELFGDKMRARAAAREAGVPVLEGAPVGGAALTLQQAEEFFGRLPDGAAMVIKARNGGGGRGMRVVTEAAEVAAAYQRCRSEASSAFGSDEVYAERFMAEARHVEVQVLGRR